MIESKKNKKNHSLFAACSKSLISLMIRLICCDVLSSSFSCLFKFSRKSGLSRRQSANSSGAKVPFFTIFAILSFTFNVHFAQTSGIYFFYQKMRFLLSPLFIFFRLSAHKHTRSMVLFFTPFIEVIHSFTFFFYFLFLSLLIHPPRECVDFK
jgi:hypothetical protein